MLFVKYRGLVCVCEGIRVPSTKWDQRIHFNAHSVHSVHSVSTPRARSSHN